jgi:hypothetical protein
MSSKIVCLSFASYLFLHLTQPTILVPTRLHCTAFGTISFVVNFRMRASLFYLPCRKFKRQSLAFTMKYQFILILADLMVCLGCSRNNDGTLFVHYGRLLFVDGTHGTTHHDWPLFTPATIDSFNRLRAVGYCLVDSECGPAQSWMLECMRMAEPSWNPQVIFNDSKLAEASITQVFPDAQVFLCWWHIVQRLLAYKLYSIFIFIH